MSDWKANFGGVGRTPPTWAARRPLRIAILGDFGAGALTGRLDTGAALARRKPRRVEFDTLEDVLARAELRLALPLGPGGALIEVPIESLDGFHPDELYRQVELFSALAGLRKRLNTPSSFAAAASEVQAWADGAGRPISAQARRTPARGAAPSRSARLDDFARLTGRTGVAEAGEASLQDFMRRIVGPFVVPADSPKKDALVATVEEGLSDAMRAVLHHGDFQNLESLWRGVDFLLRRLETGPQFQVHLIDISAEELAADLAAVDDLADSGLYKLLVEQPAQDADGGYSYIAGCYQFDATPVHAELLGRAARVAAHAGAPFLTGIATDAFTDRREPPHRLVQEAFQALREMPDASFLALLGPRFLLRHPYGKRSDPISSFAFEEFSRSSGLRGMLWGHPALLALCVLGVRGGQLTIDDLAFHHYRDEDGDSIALPCTDRLISTDQASLLRAQGINGVMAHKGEARVRLAGLEAVNGDGLAATTGAPRQSASDSRALIGSAAAQRVTTQWTPAQRTAGTVGMSLAAQRLDSECGTSDTGQEAAETASADAADVQGSADAELDALLASLESDTAPAAQPAPDSPEEAAETTEDEPAIDPELEALLKSLG